MKILYLLCAGIVAAAAFAGCRKDDADVVKLSVESINPESGWAGTAVLVNGTGFPTDANKISVTMNDIPLPILNSNEEQLLVEIPENIALLGSFPIVVTVGGNSVMSPQKFTYRDERIYIDSFSPQSGLPGASVTIKGLNFPMPEEGLSVSVNGVELLVVGASQTEIVVKIPNDPRIASGPIVVSGVGKSAQSADSFSFVAPSMTITSFSPASGGYLTEITITGEYFPTDIQLLSVTVNDKPLTILSAEDTKIIAVVPQDMGTGPIVVKAGDNVAQSASDFIYVSSSMNITGIDPSSGVHGTEITIEGSGFEQGAVVTINGIELESVSILPDLITARIPKNKMIGSGPVMVTKGNDSRVSEQNYTYIMTRKVNHYAGKGGNGYFDGPPFEAMFSFTEMLGGEQSRCGIVVDGNSDLFVADAGNMLIRKISMGGIVSTFAGTHLDEVTDWGINWRQAGGSAYAEFKPSDLGIDSRNYLYTVDNWLSGTFMIDTDALTYYLGWGTGAGNLAVDEANNRFYFSDISGKVYLSALDSYGLYPPNGTVIIDAMEIRGMAVEPDTGDLYVVAFAENKIYKYEKDKWNNPIFVAGSGVAGYKDGPVAEAQFSSPWKICFDNYGNLLVAGNGTADGGDNPDQSIRCIDLRAGVVTTFAGSGTAGNQNGAFLTDSWTGVNYQTATEKPFPAFSGPSSLAVDKNDYVYVLDRKNGIIKVIVTE